METLRDETQDRVTLEAHLKRLLKEKQLDAAYVHQLYRAFGRTKINEYLQRCGVEGEAFVKSQSHSDISGIENCRVD